MQQPPAHAATSPSPCELSEAQDIDTVHQAGAFDLSDENYDDVWRCYKCFVALVVVVVLNVASDCFVSVVVVVVGSFLRCSSAAFVAPLQIKEQ